VGWVDDRHGYFLPADGVHLFAQDVLDFGQGSFGEVQVGENPRPERTDESGPHQEFVAFDLGLGRGLAQGLAEELTNSHIDPPF
jgi:hypothetical protein